MKYKIGDIFYNKYRTLVIYDIDDSGDIYNFFETDGYGDAFFDKAGDKYFTKLIEDGDLRYISRDCKASDNTKTKSDTDIKDIVGAKKKSEVVKSYTKVSSSTVEDINGLLRGGHAVVIIGAENDMEDAKDIKNFAEEKLGGHAVVIIG